MSLMNNHQRDAAEPKVNTDELRMPGLISRYSRVGQLASLDNSTPPNGMSPVEVLPRAFPGVTRALADPITSPGVTHQLPDVQTRALAPLNPLSRNNTTALRQPMIIRASSRKKSVTTTALTAPLRSKKSRLLTHLGVTSLLVFIMLGTLLAVAPVSRGEGGLGGILPSLINGSNVKSNNIGQLTQEQARATAAANDGHDTVGYSGTVMGGVGSNLFPYPQCTYWASQEYYNLTGHWVNWRGDAYTWADSAAAAGWVVSTTPHYPSIIVLQGGAPYTGENHASSFYGHVAVVEGIDTANGIVHTSNMNWGGMGGTVASVDFPYGGGGVQFIWFPGA